MVASLKILFICNQGKHRSKTAEDIFKNNYETKSAGIYSEIKPLIKKNILWADIIITMDEHQRKFISEKFPKEYMMKKILCWDIPDIYKYKDEKLISVLNNKIKHID